MARTEDSHVAKLASIGVEPTPSLVDPADTDLPETVPVVSVRAEAPAQTIANVAVLNASNTVRPVLPQDPRRRRAVIIAVDNDVYLASSLEVAQAAEGTASSTLAFYLPKSLVLTIESKGALWASATTTATASRVSVMVEKDDG